MLSLVYNLTSQIFVFNFFFQKFVMLLFIVFTMICFSLWNLVKIILYIYAYGALFNAFIAIFINSFFLLLTNLMFGICAQTFYINTWILFKQIWKDIQHNYLKKIIVCVKDVCTSSTRRNKIKKKSNLK